MFSISHSTLYITGIFLLLLIFFVISCLALRKLVHFLERYEHNSWRAMSKDEEACFHHEHEKAIARTKEAIQVFIHGPSPPNHIFICKSVLMRRFLDRIQNRKSTAKERKNHIQFMWRSSPLKISWIASDLLEEEEEAEEDIALSSHDSHLDNIPVASTTRDLKEWISNSSEYDHVKLTQSMDAASRHQSSNVFTPFIAGSRSRAVRKPTRGKENQSPQ